ncbi:MAG TPA: outer membrane beta-barrel protein [Verrucomicrobiae bacterium]|nr:outer membrane beta-barrel protein [Verrucomicrobiae bacterium]
MSKIVSIAVIVAGAALAVAPGFAQEENRSEVSVQAFGSFVKSTTNNGIDQSATNSGGVLANYRFFFSNSHGVEVNYGYSLNTQTFGLVGGPLGVKANQHEVTAAYVYRHKMGAITPFVEAGVGGLIFDPREFAGASTQTRAAFVYGGGADFNITGRLFLRAEYRGFVYNSPTFDIAATQGTDRITHRAEPSVGFGYRF